MRQNSPKSSHCSSVFYSVFKTLKISKIYCFYGIGFSGLRSMFSAAYFYFVFLALANTLITDLFERFGNKSWILFASYPNFYIPSKSLDLSARE